MKLLFCVQGEGRGHLTQAMAVKQTVEAHGHQVVGCMVGLSSNRSLPEYFESAMRVPLVVLPTVEFVYTQNRSVNLPGTLSSALWHARRHRDSLRKINVMVREYKPDIIINFFEPLAALYAASRRRRPPVLVIAHQFMLEHPDYVHAPGLRVQQAGLKWFVQLVGLASTKLALSLYEAPDLPEKSLFVCPPILRKQLFDLQPDPDGKFALIYLLNHGYADQIIRWHEAHPELELHCFYDRPGAPPEQRHDTTLTFHRLDGNKFLKMMADCRCVVSTAGFESVGEAAYLGKPMFLVPVQNHIEQQLNALDAVRLGLGITDNSFQLDRLAELPARLPTTEFRAWVQRAESTLMRTIERVVENRA